MAQSKLEQSRAPGGAHHFLQQLEGAWQGSTKTWFEPGKLADESPITAVIRPVLNGRFVSLEYSGTLMEKPMTGMFLFGYNLQRSKFEGSWVDSCHMGTGIMFCEGERMQRGFWLLGHYDAPEGPPWGWRTEVERIDSGRLVVTMYNITPDGEEAKAVEMTFSAA